MVFPTADLPTVIVYVRTYDSLGNYEKYQLPMTVVSGPLADQVLQTNSAAIMAHVKSHAGEGLLCDALQSDELCFRLLELIRSSQEFKSRQGRLVGQVTPPTRRTRRGKGSRSAGGRPSRATPTSSSTTSSGSRSTDG